MVLYKKDNKRPFEEQYEMIKAGYRLEHPEKINGFAGLLWSPGDVYVTEEINDLINSNKELHFFNLGSKIFSHSFQFHQFCFLHCYLHFSFVNAVLSGIEWWY